MYEKRQSQRCSWVHLHRRPFVYVYPQKGVKKGKMGANLSVKQYVLTSIGKDE